MSAVLHAAPQAMSRGQLEAMVTILRTVAIAAQRLRHIQSQHKPNYHDQEMAEMELDQALTKAGYP